MSEKTFSSGNGPSSPVAGTSNDKHLQSAVSISQTPNLSRQLLEALVHVGQIAAQMLGASGTPAPAFSDRADFSLTVAEMVNDFLRAKARAQRSDRYLRALRVSLRSFAKGRFSKPLAEVTPTEIETWLQSQNWSARTQRGYLSDVSTMFNFAMRRGMLNYNPARAVELPEAEEAPRSIHTPGETKTVLEFAREYDLNICRSLAVRYFAGLRSAEIERIEEEEIKADFIEVTAAKSKTRRRRLVTIQPNLKAWLQLGGKLPLHDVNNRMRWFTAALKKRHGLEWDHNVTRHSFCSYHLAHFRKASETALEAGHTEQMLFTHYRELVTPADAVEYWQITPLSG